MNLDSTARVTSLHLHPAEPGEPMRSVEEIAMVAGKGITANDRYFGRVSRSGLSSKRQVSLMEREQIAEHASALGLETIAPGAVRANIETVGINLVECIGEHVEIGSVLLFVYEARTPCWKMDRICEGLRNLMDNGKQGVLAQIVRGGTMRIGDAIRVCSTDAVSEAFSRTEVQQR